MKRWVLVNESPEELNVIAQSLPHFLQTAALSVLNKSHFSLPYPGLTQVFKAARGLPALAFPSSLHLPGVSSSSDFSPTPPHFLCSGQEQLLLWPDISSHPGTPRRASQEPWGQVSAPWGAWRGSRGLKSSPLVSLLQPWPPRDALLAPCSAGGGGTLQQAAFGGAKGTAALQGWIYWRQRVFAEECCSAPLTPGDISAACTKPRASFLLLSTSSVKLGGSGRRACSRKMWETNYKFLYKSKCVFLNTPPRQMSLRFSFHNKSELWTF